MEKRQFYLWALMLFFVCMPLASCTDDNDGEEEDPLEAAHFDIWVSIGETSGMGSTNTQLVQGVKSLEDQTNIDFSGKGADVTAKLYQESIIKGQYYYQVPQEKDRFGKYKISNTSVTVVKEFAFKQNTLKDRRYTHAWIDDDTLVLMAANGDASKVIWIKVDALNMAILDEGELDLPALPAGGTFSTSGIAGYRKSDHTILYSYLNNKDKTKFYMAFIDPSDMSVGSVAEESRAQFMAGTAYGELLQSKSFFDADGNYYLACNSQVAGASSSTIQYGTLLRINKGEKAFDASYMGFQTHAGSHGKIITAQYLASDKALLYVQDPTYTGAAGWGSDYNCYYAVLDLQTDGLTVLGLPYSEGTFSQRSVVLGRKAYIGVNPKDASPAVYIYDIASGTLTQGITITEGYAFDRIVDLQD
ncbi:MAG: hypothetical protein QM786_09170 [Breznakibacter sp.]